MSRTQQSAVEAPIHPRRVPTKGGYVPSWWEKRFPWILDVLAAMDPEPLTDRIAEWMEPVQRALGACAQPAAEAMAWVGRGVEAAMGATFELSGRFIRALPLPSTLRRWLWLEPPRLRPDGSDYAQLVVKRQYAVVLPLSIMFAVVVHAAVFVFAPMIQAADLSAPVEEMLAVELPPDIHVPPPPPPIARPAAPIVPTERIAEDITIVPTQIDDVVTVDLPPLPPIVTEPRDTVPTFTPYTVAPRILNAEELQELMVEEYPPILRRSGIGGRVGIRALVGAEGAVERVEVILSSGHESLDRAAERVGMQMRCSPALNRDVAVRAWVTTAVNFGVR